MCKFSFFSLSLTDFFESRYLLSLVESVKTDSAICHLSIHDLSIELSIDSLSDRCEVGTVGQLELPVEEYTVQFFSFLLSSPELYGLLCCLWTSV